MTTQTTRHGARDLATGAGIRVYNTLSRTKQPFQPVEPGKVGIYLCGPTVYDRAHIGHMVGPVIFDCIKRYLTYCSFDVTWVVNITDVDDKLINKANERGISMAEVATENTADYLANLAALGVDTIDHYPKATDHMQQILDFTQSLIDKGFAYASERDVYFEVGKDAEYGKLTNRSVDEMEGGGGGTAARKRSPGDFALWKSAKPGEPSWESPWGPGRPGWHIECSAMSRALLGETFDIHGGGLDLIFPHHENEIAQSECCHGKPMAQVWMHNGLLRAGSAAGKLGGRGDREAGGDAGGKMSRSKGAGGLAELIERQGGERIRFFLLRTHYRSTVLFSEEAIDEAGAGLDTFARFFRRYERITGQSFYDLDVPQNRAGGELQPGGDATLARVAELRGDFLAAMDDDFNTGGAIGALFELAHLLNKFCEEGDLEGSGGSDTARVDVLRRGAVVLGELAGTLGLFRAAPAAAGDDSAATGPLMGLVIELRAAARAAKNFATADRIRDALTAAGITLEDRAGGTEWDAAGPDVLPAVMELLIGLRATSRDNKDFATADRIRDAVAAAGITLEDRAGGTEWTRG